MSRTPNLKNRGDIDSPSRSYRRIRISTRLKNESEELLEVVLHECLHGLFWDMGEEAIQAAGQDLAKLLTQLGATISLKSVPTEVELD